MSTSYMTLVQPDGLAVLRDIDGNREAVALITVDNIAEEGTMAVLLWSVVCQLRDVSHQLKQLNELASRGSKQGAPDLREVVSQVSEMFPGLASMLQQAEAQAGIKQ